MDDFLLPFQKDFGRRDRYFWAKGYLQGLLSDLPRKTMDGIARLIAEAGEYEAENARQALQNFLQESPWSEDVVLRRYRQRFKPLLQQESRLVLLDISLPKQGQHSVGVHRQLCPDQEKKINCQIVTTLLLATDDLIVPLAMRLYLPRTWQADPDRLKASRVPTHFQTPRSRIDFALEMVKELQDEGLAFSQLCASPSYSRAPEFHDRLTDLRMTLDTDDASWLDRARSLVEHLRSRLGLDHFEGRSWNGLHHHLCLVILAFGSTLE